MKSKKIGIMTVGGDCSGLNSVIRAACMRAKIMGHELIGIRRGFFGLFPENFDHVSLDTHYCHEGMLTTSGSILYSDTKSFTERLKNGKSTEEVLRLACDGYHKLSLDGLVYIGGDGSLAILKELLSHHRDLKVVAVPKTIDNDVNITDLSIGFQTAVEVVSNAVRNIRATARSHERTMVIEVMGRDAGFIAIYAGIASGADIILVPEFKYNFEMVISKIREVYASGKDHCIILVAEAVESDDLKHYDEAGSDAQVCFTVKYKGIGQHIADRLQKANIDSRAVVLGHTQRGGDTAVLDRIVGTAFGAEAINAVSDETYGIMLCYINGRVKRVPISDIMENVHRRLDHSDICVKMARDLGVYIGEI
ncbi:MAG: ATP-dependent 6-phosphofructokinase [Holosporales bacterium]|jgi:6-phosphofructokinase 1|nr:ATP-dependent 6-phosphofructokinase [Holosporales bacterium]